MKKMIILMSIMMVTLLAGCDKETIKENIPDNVTDEQVQEYVEKNYPEYSDDVSEILEDDAVAVEDIISESLNGNLNGMIDIYDDISCWINVTPGGRQVLVDLRCYDSSINDSWCNINSSMYLLDYVLNDLNSNIDSFMKYGIDIVDKSSNKDIIITFDYYNEDSQKVQYLNVLLDYVDEEFRLERIGMYRQWDAGSGKLSWTRMLRDELLSSEYSPFIKSGVYINSDGTIEDAYKYVE